MGASPFRGGSVIGPLAARRAKAAVVFAVLAAGVLIVDLLNAPEVMAATVPASGAKIVEVTVFPDRAEVIREARVDLPAGASTIEFTGLPWQVEPDSLRVTAKGVAATLGAVEFKQAADQPKDSPDFLAAQAEVDRISAEIRTLKADEANAKDLREFITALKAATAARESENLAAGKPDLPSVQAVYAFVRTSLQDLSKQSLERSERLQKLDKDQRVAQAKLEAARPAAAIRTRTATVDAETRQAGPLTLRLAYVSPGAYWRPAYRASLDAATGEIALTSEAVVAQSSGEDWSGVALRLSTASPARGVQPPQMSSLLLRPIEYVAQAKGGFVGGVAEAAPAAPPSDVMRMQANAAGEGMFAGDLAIESGQQEAGVVHSEYNVAFEVPGRSDVPTDGRDHRVGLRQETLKGTVEYRAVPALNAAAFLVAKTQSPPGYPLLTGPVRVFAGGAYLGSFGLRETAPKTDLTLPFGIDNRIAVERTPLPQDRSESGIFGKEKRIAYAFRTTVENLRDQKATVVVEDRIPVSEDERIHVEQGKGTTPGSKEVKDRPGVLEWTLDLAPHEKREVILEYTVRFPKDLFVPGLE